MASAGTLRGGVTILPGVQVRVLSGEYHSLTNQVTQYGVESGKSIADHVIMRPNMLDIRFEMPNSNNGRQKAADVFHQIAKMRDEREPIIVDTEHARYKNMVIVGFTPDHVAPFKGAIGANVRLSQVGIIGEQSQVEASGGRPEKTLSGDGTNKTGSAAQDSGSVTPNTSRAIRESIQSFLSRISAT